MLLLPALLVGPGATMSEALSTQGSNGAGAASVLDRGDHAAAKIATGDTIDVRSFKVTERMNGLFEIKLVAVSGNPDIDFEAAVGQPMTFSLHGEASGAWRAPRERTWAGICRDLRQVRVEEHHLSTYELTLVPTLWLLSQRRNHRIFQLMTEVDIVQKILGEWGIVPVMKLADKYKKRKYRVQYGESDYRFICRMLEDAGVSFYFDASGGSRLVLDDGPQRNEARPPIAFRDLPTVAELEHVTKVRFGRRLRPGKYTVRDHDYRRAATFKLGATAVGPDAGDVEAGLERFHWVPGAFLYESTKAGDDTPYADDRGKYREEEPEGEALVERRLQAKRVHAREVVFETNTFDPAPGVVLSFLDHPKTELGTGKRLLVVDATYSGTIPAAGGQWVHEISAVGADTPYRPALRTQKPRVQGVECATVVGPAGEEIHTDEFGRVRVSFHWDRESQMNQDSSCWIHVNQPWGGTTYGGTNLPRVGQEVIVDFLGADPDRPIVVGRVYTNLQKTPYALPQNKTQSGWKSNSSPTTGGYNEIMMEDKAGEELLRVQAQKDLNELVKHDQQSTVGNDRTTSIGNNEDQTVGNNLTQQVLNNLSEMVGTNRSRTVGNNETVQVGGNQSTNVGQVVSIVCGKSSLTMDKDGNINLSGTKITVNGSDHVQVASALIDLN
jgi:type VI secretion system secreted protein VgrG